MEVITAPPRVDFASELGRWRTLRRLSQLDLALRAGTTQRHISYLERGRSSPGRSLAIRLAESLELALRPSSASQDSTITRCGSSATPSIASFAGHMPYPAVVVAPDRRLVAANTATDLLTEGAAADPLEPPVNMLRLVLHPDGMGSRILNLGESLRLASSEGELQLISTLTSFATALDVTLAELHLEAFLPADDATAQALRQRAERPSADRSARLPAELLVATERP